MNVLDKPIPPVRHIDDCASLLAGYIVGLCGMPVDGDDLEYLTARCKIQILELDLDLGERLKQRTRVGRTNG